MVRGFFVGFFFAICPTSCLKPVQKSIIKTKIHLITLSAFISVHCGIVTPIFLAV